MKIYGGKKFRPRRRTGEKCGAPEAVSCCRAGSEINTLARADGQTGGPSRRRPSPLTFQHGIGLQQLALDGVHLLRPAGDGRHVLHDQLGGFCLAGAALARYHNTLVRVVLPYSPVRLLGHGVPEVGGLVSLGLER